VNGPLYRSLSVTTRGLDVDKREATFVASTENPVQTWWGNEVLRMKGADLSRYRNNPVFLDAHDGSTVDNVLGSASRTDVVGKELEVVLRFAETDKGERAWKLVQQGHVRAVSIGYRVDRKSLVEVAENATVEGVRGPAVIVNRWELLEVSLVPVPADRDALMRSALLKEGRMADTKEQAASVQTDAGAPEGKSVYQQAVANAPAQPARTVETGAAEAREAARAQAIRALAPADLRELADDLVLEGVSVEDARKRLQAARAERSKPLGTPEPKTSTPTKSALSDLSDEALLRSLKRAF